MGTNYYLRCREPRMVYDSYHVAKRSSGWEPSFEGYPYEGDYAHDGLDDERPAIGSVADIKAAYDTGLYDIVDEYGSKLTWDEFERDVVGWDGGRGRAREHNGGGYPQRRDETGAHFAMCPFS